ncbi:type II toxin-antitoxin system VapC family toxin [Candidatus Woesearchaeota archaeon]|nr:type II toxin-antitoxin system VapC family toxin [Candidatus Woesearchaeota archaeon]
MMLIDTNIFVDRLRNYAAGVRFFESIAGKENVIFSAITGAELLAGKANEDSSKRAKLSRFLRQWDKKVIDNPVSALAGDLCRKHGLAIPDALVAATALLNNAELITKNVKDFKKVPDLRLNILY